MATPKKEQAAKPTLLKATISGSFKASDGEIESYDRVTGYLPPLHDDKAQQMITKRYASIWIGATPKRDREGNVLDELKYKRVQRVREVFVDSIDDLEPEDENYGKQLSYIGKDIMEMNYEELQDLAAAKDLIAVPLYKKGSLVNARRIAFVEYANKVLGWTDPKIDPKTGKASGTQPLDWRQAGFNPNKYPQIIADGRIRRDSFEAADIEESIETEALLMKHGNAAPPLTGESRLTIDQLKQIAKAKNISFNEGTSYDALYKKLYPKAA